MPSYFDCSLINSLLLQGTVSPNLFPLSYILTGAVGDCEVKSGFRYHCVCVCVRDSFSSYTNKQRMHAVLTPIICMLNLKFGIPNSKDKGMNLPFLLL